MILSAATTLRGLSVCAKVCVCPLADCDKSLVHVTVLKAYKLSTGCLPGSTSPYRFFGTIDLFRYISVCIYIYIRVRFAHTYRGSYFSRSLRSQPSTSSFKHYWSFQPWKSGRKVQSIRKPLEVLITERFRFIGGNRTKAGVVRVDLLFFSCVS